MQKQNSFLLLWKVTCFFRGGWFGKPLNIFRDEKKKRSKLRFLDLTSDLDLESRYCFFLNFFVGRGDNVFLSLFNLFMTCFWLFIIILSLYFSDTLFDLNFCINAWGSKWAWIFDNCLFVYAVSCSIYLSLWFYIYLSTWFYRVS